MTWLRGVVAPSPPVCATAYTVGALTAWKHNAQPTDEPLKGYIEARDSNIKKYLEYSEKPSNSKAQSVIPLLTRRSKKNIFFKAGKGKGSRRQKNIHITNRITKFLFPYNFYKYCRNIITCNAIDRPNEVRGP